MGQPKNLAGPYMAARQRVFDTGQPQGHFSQVLTPQDLEADNLPLTQQQALFEAVQAAQETERRRMAESLHNSIGQMLLYATKPRLDQLHEPVLHTAPALVAARREAAQLLSEAIRQSRVLSHELVPMVLEEFGLAAALQDIGRKLSTPQLRFRCEAMFDDAHRPRRPCKWPSTAWPRNWPRTSANTRGASEASLEPETMPGWVLLRAEDNGAEFVPALTPASACAASATGRPCLGTNWKPALS